ncbi:unnamed protein product [Brugia timori]|uniref:Uncharacterized protein n=1 Tax=Brugia timori TaxID=42155 RepID=A0A0R3QF28_9BILA|nr:unnamed protein product [Brugia timori]
MTLFSIEFIMHPRKKPHPINGRVLDFRQIINISKPTHRFIT